MMTTTQKSPSSSSSRSMVTLKNDKLCALEARLRSELEAEGLDDTLNTLESQLFIAMMNYLEWVDGDEFRFESSVSGFGSAYVELILSEDLDDDGEVEHVESIKIRVADHDSKPWHRMNHGPVDFSASSALAAIEWLLDEYQIQINQK